MIVSDKAWGTEKIAQMRYRTDEAWQFTRFKVKFLFVMRIDKPELFVKNPIVGSAEKFLE